jgi:hypothetical protein
MDWHHLFIQLAYNLAAVLPWLLGGALGVAVISVSPLGRVAVRHLRARREEQDLLEELVIQVSAMRQELAEAAERLDGTDRLLRALMPPHGAPVQPARPSTLAPPVTPH